MSTDIRKRWFDVRRWVILLLPVLLLAGCQKAPEQEEGQTKVVLMTGFEEDELFRIGNAVCRRKEAMVYLTNMQNQYEKIYGEEFWNEKIGDMTVEEKIKNVVLSRMAQIKTMNLLAKQQGLALTQEEQEQVSQAAGIYYASLSDHEKEVLDITREDVERLYEEYTLADKVYNMIIEDTNPEISDDEARTVTVSQIVVRTVTQDADGQQIPMTDSSKKAAYEKLRTAKNLLAQGEDFYTLASRYNEAGQIAVSISKGDAEPIYETTAFNLGAGEVSDVFETSTAYVILKCESTFDQEQTQINKEKILNKRKEEAFSQIYDDFTVEQIRNLNEEMWQSVRFIHDPQVTTDSFFSSYDSVFSK